METTITNRTSLMMFAKSHGSLSIGTCTNKTTGETFKKLCFTKGNNQTYVGFSSKLGELTPAEIVAQKDELQVVELTSGTYKLCKSNSMWEDVDL